MSIQALSGGRVMDFATFLGISFGIGALIVAYFVPDWRFLAVPGMVALLPSLIYGVR
jgi:hypothetical protein